MNITIAVATHKDYFFPSDPIYLPVQAGKSRSHWESDLTGDDTGDNISIKNNNYCELTVLYWAWKNICSDYIGLCHYRRYFAGRAHGNVWDRVIKEDDLRSILKDVDVILPKKRNYWIETNYSQYIHAHHKQDLDITRDIIRELFPEYLPAFQRYMQQTKGHHFNMFIMKRPVLSSYCQWLFTILGELEKRLDYSGYDERNQRVFGYVGERLVDTWIDTNNVSYMELPVMHIERQHWIRKGTLFLWRKLRGQKV